MKPKSEKIFDYSIQIQDREFILTFRADGTSEWLDFTFQKEFTRKRDLEDTHDFSGETIGEGKAAQRLVNLEGEFSITITMSDELKTAVAHVIDNIDDGVLTRRDEVSLDRVLIPFFWERVNQEMKEPLVLEA